MRTDKTGWRRSSLQQATSHHPSCKWWQRSPTRKQPKRYRGLSPLQKPCLALLEWQYRVYWLSLLPSIVLMAEIRLRNDKIQVEFGNPQQLQIREINEVPDARLSLRRCVTTKQIFVPKSYPRSYRFTESHACRDLPSLAVVFATLAWRRPPQHELHSHSPSLYPKRHTQTLSWQLWALQSVPEFDG